MRLTSSRLPSRTSPPWTCRPHSLHSLVSDSWIRIGKRGRRTVWEWLELPLDLDDGGLGERDAHGAECGLNGLHSGCCGALMCERQTFVSATFGKELGRSASWLGKSRAIPRPARPVVPVPVPVPDATSTMRNSLILRGPRNST
jgi:hypothetical protein